MISRRQRRSGGQGVKYLLPPGYCTGVSSRRPLASKKSVVGSAVEPSCSPSFLRESRITLPRTSWLVVRYFCTVTGFSPWFASNRASNLPLRGNASATSNGSTADAHCHWRSARYRQTTPVCLQPGGDRRNNSFCKYERNCCQYRASRVRTAIPRVGPFTCPGGDSLCLWCRHCSENINTPAAPGGFPAGWWWRSLQSTWWWSKASVYRRGASWLQLR